MPESAGGYETGNSLIVRGKSDRERSEWRESRQHDSSYMAVVLHMADSVEGFHVTPQALLSILLFTISCLDVHYPQVNFGTLVAIVILTGCMQCRTICERRGSHDAHPYR
jgi:ABC-type bacteriocin/lantibiotic exporter with double-glycine peptidase domain